MPPLRSQCLIVGMTSLPSRLRNIGPTLLSIANQTRRPDRLILSLPQHSTREGCPYEIIPELRAVLSQHPWMEVFWVEDDSGPGTKVIGALEWLSAQNRLHHGDVLMILDDDHAYVPNALAILLHQQLSRGPLFVCSFFAYFYRGLMVPQGADIVAYQLEDKFIANFLAYHRAFVFGDAACFLVDDLWIAMYLWLSGCSVVSLRDNVLAQGLEMMYTTTPNAKVNALQDLCGMERRDCVMHRAFDSLVRRLLQGQAAGLARWGGAAAVQKLQHLSMAVQTAHRSIAKGTVWLESRLSAGCSDECTMQAQKRLQDLKNFYQMETPGLC